MATITGIEAQLASELVKDPSIATSAAESTLKEAGKTHSKALLKFLDPAKTLLSMDRRTEEQKSAMDIEKGRKKLFRKMKRQMKRQGNYDASQLAMRYKSALSADEGNTLSKKGNALEYQVGPDGSMANERELARQADAGERVITDNINKAAKAALQTTSALVGGIPGAVINAGISGMDASQSGGDGGMAFAKSIGGDAINMYGGQILAQGEKALLANRSVKEASRLNSAREAFDTAQANYLDDIAAGGDGSAFQGRMDRMGNLLSRREERFKIADANYQRGTTALGDLVRRFNKQGLAGLLTKGNDIIQNEAGIDPQAAPIANPSGPTYDPFTVNTLYNPIP